MNSQDVTVKNRNQTKTGIRRVDAFMGTLIMASLLVFCGNMIRNGANGGNGGDDGAAQSDTSVTDTTTTVYQAELTSLNDSVSGMSASGLAVIRVKGDTMFIDIAVAGVEPGMMHLQHYHGFPDGQDATCASMDQDINGDGIVDLIETEDVSGITMVPFNAQPAQLELTADSYPQASDQGTYIYNDTVLLSELRPALLEKIGTDSLQLENRVVYIHGISNESQLPESVQSLPGVPPQVTLPVACGKLNKVDDLPFGL